MAYKRGSLQPRGHISGIKKKRFEMSHSSVVRKTLNVFHLLVFNKALKRLPFHFELEGGGGLIPEGGL